jgi:pyridoxamine 5'-phosphate oxidase
MRMNTREEVLAFVNENPDFALATMDGNVPHVRTLMLHKANSDGIYFMVAKFKDVYRQLSLNPNVELCFHTKEVQLRISGQVESLDRDLDLKKEVLEARPFMKSWIEQTGLKAMAVFRLSSGKATVWQLTKETEPKSYFDF